MPGTPVNERPHDHSPEGAEQVFTTYLRAVLAGEAISWETFRAGHADLGTTLDALYEDFQRGRELIGQIEAGSPRDAADATPRDRLDLEFVLRELHQPRPRDSLRLLGSIARGGMALIERVWDARLRRALARKVLPLDVRAAQTPFERRRLSRFLEEAHICSQLQHPGVLPVFELGIDERGYPFFTMPIVQGQDFGAVIRCVHASRDDWTLMRALQILVSVCDTVAYAHAKGIVHRDLKPENLMIGRFGEAFVMDWGLAKVEPKAAGRLCNQTPGSVEIDSLRKALATHEETDALRTLDGDVVGTPAFMAPEQAAGFVAMVEAHSDQYALGAILYQLLTARRPYEDRPEGADPTALVAMVRQEGPTPVAQLAPRTPSELVAICGRAMQREPAARYGNVAALAADLRAYLEDRVVQAYRTGHVATLRKWTRRNRGFAAMIATTFVLVIAGLVAFVATIAHHARRLEETNTDLRAAQSELGERVRDLRRAVYYNDIAFVQRAQQDGTDGKEVKRVLAACPPELRGWEWQYLSQLTDTSARQVAVERHCQISPDGSLVAGLVESTIVVHDLVRGTIVHRVPCRGIADAIAFSADQQLLACWSRDRVLRVCDLTTGAIREVQANTDRDGLLAFSPDHTWLAVRVGHGDLLVLDANTLTLVKQLRHESARLTAIAWVNPDQLVVGDSAGKLHVWKPGDWSCTELAVSTDQIVSVVAPPPGTKLLISDVFGTVKSVQGTEVREIRRNTLRVGFAQIDPTGQWLANCHNTTVALTNLQTGQSRLLHGHDTRVLRLSFSATGTLAACTDAITRLWHVQAPAGLHLLGRCRAGVSTLSIAPDKSAVIAAAGHELVRMPLDGSEFTRCDLSVGGISGVCHTPAGDRVIAIGQGQKLRLLHPATLASIQDLEVDLGLMEGLALAPDDERVLVASEFKGTWRNAFLFDLAPGGEARPFSIACIPSESVFAPDGRRFAMAGSDGLVHIYDATTLNKLHEVRITNLKLESIDWSPDGRFLAASGRNPPGFEIMLIDPDRGEIVGRLDGHRGPALGLRFTRDGRLLSTSNADGTLRVWDIEALRCVLVIPLPANSWGRMRLSRDGRVLAIATGNEVWVWTRN